NDGLARVLTLRGETPRRNPDSWCGRDFNRLHLEVPRRYSSKYRGVNVWLHGFEAEQCFLALGTLRRLDCECTLPHTLKRRHAPKVTNNVPRRADPELLVRLRLCRRLLLDYPVRSLQPAFEPVVNR